MSKQYKGFIPPEGGIQPDHWVLGASNTSPFPTVHEYGDWAPFLPNDEKQNIRNIETYNCTSFNTLNALEILMFKKFGVKVNYSDRWLGIMAGNKPPGNDPHKVCEAIRKYGLIPEEMLPFSDDIKNVNEYYSFKGMSQAQIDACYAEGKRWLDKYEFKHAWVCKENQPLDEKINNLKVALKSSPLGIAVFAWASNDKDIYYANGPENHWTGVISVNDLIKIYDSYPPFIKLTNQSPVYCKVFSIEERGEITKEEASWLMQQINKLWEMVWGIKRDIDKLPPAKEKYPEKLTPSKGDYLYDISKGLLGRRLTMDSTIPIHLGCAQAVSYVLNKAGIPMPPKGIPGTWTLWDWLSKSSHFEEIDKPEKGCVVISPTEHAVGHVGICGQLDYMYKDDFAIMSNNSDTGLYDTHWKHKDWINYYEGNQKLNTYYFRFIG